jgi:hypothetical protein
MTFGTTLVLMLVDGVTDLLNTVCSDV